MTPSFSTPALFASDECSRSIPECVSYLTVLFAFQRELMRIEAAWLPGVPYWDAKQAIARHVLEDASHAEALLKRLHELKATSAERRQVAGLDELLQDVASAAHGDEWLRGLYGFIKPWFITFLEEYLRHADAVMDEPSQVVVSQIIACQQKQIAWFEDFSPAFSPWELSNTDPWCVYVKARLEAVTFKNSVLQAQDAPRRLPSHPDFGGIAKARRDRTFQMTHESQQIKEGCTFEEKRFFVFYHHVQEMQFAESLCTLLYETAEMPWAFHYDLARHLADEVRHATMGQKRLEQLGVKLTEVPMLTQNYEFRSNMDPLEKFCTMTLVMEAGSFERKRANLELFEKNEDRVSALYESYDIRDEMLHTNFGHLWVPILLRVYHDSRSVSELTEHCRGMITQSITEYPAR